MKTIHKYVIAAGVSDQIMKVAEGSHPLAVQVQHGEVTIWYETYDLDPSTQTVEWQIAVRGTGHKLTGVEGDYLGTVQVLGGSLVWHIYVKTD